MKKTALFLLVFGFIFSSVSFAGTLANDVLGNLFAMRTFYDAMYAPKDWKKKYANYDLERTFTEAVAAVNANPQLTEEDSRQIFKNFIYAMRDYHTSIRFQSTEAASLPFTIKGAGDRFFIAYIDREKLPESTFPFSVGDEIITFSGKPVLEAVKEVQAQTIENVSGTDRALAELQLTSRSTAGGLKVPQGPVEIGIKRNGSSEVSEIQMIWTYQPELIRPRGNFMEGLQANSKLNSRAEKNTNFRPMMDVDLPGVVTAAENPFGIGNRKTFTPDLGTKIWESDKDGNFYAYIYKNAARKLIGYVRIPSYVPNDSAKAVKEFAKIIEHFENNTDAMVIDQVNNPGGSVFYLYALASMLSEKPLKTPMHRMSLNQEMVKGALDSIKVLEGVKNDADAKKAYDGADTIEGYPVSYEFAQFELNYDRFLVSEWNAGRKLTNPYWIGGVNQINPAATTYTKPILLLTNHLDFSGGDFFPAIMQDNKRVTILGSRTAGAGGYVNDVPLLNNVGIARVRVTESIAERVSLNPIENLGITPDIPYEMTPEDYTNNFAPYAKAIQSAVDGMIK